MENNTSEKLKSELERYEIIFNYYNENLSRIGPNKGYLSKIKERLLELTSLDDENQGLLVWSTLCKNPLYRIGYKEAEEFFREASLRDGELIKCEAIKKYIEMLEQTTYYFGNPQGRMLKKIHKKLEILATTHKSDIVDNRISALLTKFSHDKK